jgi:hypothetical protein
MSNPLQFVPRFAWYHYFPHLHLSLPWRHITTNEGCSASYQSLSNHEI